MVDITHDIEALGFQDTHDDIEEEDYYLWWSDKPKEFRQSLNCDSALLPHNKLETSTDYKYKYSDSTCLFYFHVFDWNSSSEDWKKE